MKIQCPCGTKYAFDVTPEMAQTPVQFVCQVCGLDASDFVNELIRQELGLEPQTAAAAPPEPQPALPPPPPATPVARLRTHTASSTGTTTFVKAASQPCLKHPGQVLTQRCYVCGRWMCPKCMELFGYVCSPLCKAKAEATGIDMPVYAHQKSVVEGKFWRKVWLAGGAVAAVVLAFVGLWVWYAWFGSVPHPAFSIRFAEPGYSGQSRLVSKDQLVFLHAGKLARYDLKTKKEVWSQMLIDRQKIKDEANASIAQMKAFYDKLKRQGGDEDSGGFGEELSLDKMVAVMERMEAAALDLRVEGESVWVASPAKLVRYDWQSGRPVKEISLSAGYYRMYPRGQELLLVSQKPDGQEVANHLNLASGEMRTEELSAPSSRTPAGGSSAQTSPGLSGLLAQATQAAQAGSKPLDPDAVAARAQKLPVAARLALPAVLAAAANQQRAMSELRGQSRPMPSLFEGEREDHFIHGSLIPDANGFVQFSVQLLEKRLVERQAMKDRPKKSAFDGPINQAATASIANEIFNDMQRDRGGDKVLENVSRYQVTLRRAGAGSAPAWTGEVIGPPELHPLKTVNVLTAGKSITVFDKTNKRLWESKLNYDVPAIGGRDEDSRYGQGPCVERGNTLYVFDQGVLTAFDLASGEARWRLPTVGVSGLFFDDQGMIYANSTTASPDSIKYSRQIDVTERKADVVLKVDPKTGKTLWRTESEGWVSYVSGKFIYTSAMYQADDDEADGAFGVRTGLEVRSHLRIKRLDAGKGKVLWEHFQRRCPLDVQFEKNSIQLVFRKEVQVLKFIAL